MTKITKKIIAWIFGAIAFVAFSFGLVFTVPQVKTAQAADTAVTFSKAYLEGDGSDGIMKIRMDTNGQTWTNSANDKLVSELPSTVADYTTINGRTLTELQNACTSATPIRVTLQPAGDFSFMRIFVPTDFMTTSQVRSFGVLDGWAFNDGAANYTSSATTYLRTGDNTMVLPESYTSNTMLTSADITISDAQLVNPTNAEWGADSYMVDITIGKSFGAYDTMYDGYKYVRNAIYINGKSIEEWNTQMIAEDARFNDPSTYTRFPQNSTDSSHKTHLVKPVGLWGTDTGFRLSIFQELVSDCETITVTVGSGCWLDGNFMVAERVSKTVLTQTVVDITNKLTFLNNSHNSPEAWGATNMYYIHTNNEACWTKAPKGGCLNELDPAALGGGQIQMKYVTFNGSTLWDINKNDDGSYESTQENIVNGGVYAPILAIMSSEMGSSLRLTVPTAYTNGKSGHEEIVIKKGFSVYENGVSYYVSRDVVFTNDGTSWSKEIKAEEIATEVTAVITKANRTDGGTNERFMILELSNNDYAGCSTTAIADFSSLFGYIDVGGTVIESTPSEPFFNVWGIQNSVAFRISGWTADNVQQVPYITIKAGAKFPSYNTQLGAPLTYFVTSEDVTFIHDVPNDTWTVGTYESGTEHTVTFTVDGATYHTATVENGATVSAPTDPTKDADANYTYTFSQWTLNGAAYDFNTAVTSDITLVAEFTATPISGEIDITDEINFIYQAQQSVGTETYLIRTTNNYWTKAPKGGCLNEYDVDGLDPVGGQIQMKYIYFNGKSLYDINREDDGVYGSEQGSIKNGGQYAPILVLMGSDGGNYSYIQLHVPTLYGGDGTSANENHQTIELKAGFSVTENGVTYVTTKDLKWVNLDGAWTTADNVLEADAISIGDAYIGGDAGDLVVVDITCDDWNFARNALDYNYYSHAYFIAMRENIFINGVSLLEINTTVDDSNYNYVTSPQTIEHTGTYNDETYDTFANPIFLYGSGNMLRVSIFKDYVASLGAGDITLTVGKGFQAIVGDALELGKPLGEDVSKAVTANYSVTVDGLTQIIYKGKTAVEPSIPQKDMTETATYVFENWYDVATGEVFDFSTKILRDYEIEARFIETEVNLIETEVSGVVHKLRTTTVDENNNPVTDAEGNPVYSDDTWMIFTLTNHDYPADVTTWPLSGVKDVNDYSELLRIGFLDRVILKGEIEGLNGAVLSQATLKDVYDWHGPQEGPYINIWGNAMDSLAIRVPVGRGVEEIVIEEGCFFPSYRYLTGEVNVDTRYAVMRTSTYAYSASEEAFIKQASIAIDIQMEMGASVRLSGDDAGSGIRFETKISAESVALIRTLLSEEVYESIAFGTLIVPKDYLMGGSFTHDWLTANYGEAGTSFIDIESSAYADDEGIFFPVYDEESGYYSYFGSIVQLKEKNYGRDFVGLGYVVCWLEGEPTYIYSQYDPVNSRSAAFIANAAINDRSDTQTSEYKNYISANNNYSPYTQEENIFLEKYLTWTETSAINSQVLTALASKGGSVTITPTTTKLAGPYVELLYNTNVDVWGQFVYTDGSKTATEDFYLQEGTTRHKQYLDIFRTNGVGYGMNTQNLSMTSIKFTNAELEQTKAGEVKVIALYSQNKSIDTSNQEIYLTVAQQDASEITVGAHLGLGGALTYLAKSGIYEGIKKGSGTSYNKGTLGIGTSTSEFESSHNTAWYGSEEAGYYGHATSSKAADGAVNLINNYDAGRQIQQSWYAEVGGSDSEATGANGYTRAFCTTESSAGKYWPYNPVQAGDVVSNPSQIVDYEINTSKGYIYVKTRAMDWAKGKSSDNLENTIDGGSTTKSYMENYYRLKNDGTLTVNNGFIDWNGFTDMASCDWASTELPAVYPVHTLNYYASNVDGDGTWADAIEYDSGLSSWTSSPYYQFANSSSGATKVEDWFAWVNGGDENAFGIGIYIPNVARFTSGRSVVSTSYSVSANKNANSNILKQKGLMSNMQEIKYTYQSAYVGSTSYTAPGIDFRMEAYVPIEYSYVICLGTVGTIRETFKEIKDNGTVTNVGNAYEKVGLDAWARADKKWTW